MCLSNFSGCELIALSSSIAISIGSQLSSIEAVNLANFFTALGDNLTIIATQKALEESSQESNDINNCNF